MFVNCPLLCMIMKLVFVKLAPVQKACAKPKKVSVWPLMLLVTLLEIIVLVLEKTS